MWKFRAHSGATDYSKQEQTTPTLTANPVSLGYCYITEFRKIPLYSIPFTASHILRDIWAANTRQGLAEEENRTSVYFNLGRL